MIHILRKYEIYPKLVLTIILVGLMIWMLLKPDLLGHLWNTLSGNKTLVSEPVSRLILFAVPMSTLFFCWLRSRLNERSLLLAKTLTSMSAILVTDNRTRIIAVNPAFTRLFGYTLEDLDQLTPKILQSGKHSTNLHQQMWDSLNSNGKWSGEVTNRARNGELVCVWLEVNEVSSKKGGASPAYVANFTDIKKFKDTELVLKQLSQVDALTGIPNRRGFDLEIKRLISKSTRRFKHPFSLIVLDLDHFKYFNDKYGHVAGDEVLQNSAVKMQEALRGEDYIFRVGGEEFTVLLDDCDLEKAELVAKKLKAAVTQMYRDTKVTASFGIAQFNGFESESQLYSRADQALYFAKENGRNCIKKTA
ncbi:diguanylate cyclase [Alginatibacterium sediminis]|uniref:Diguanylate cyclase n=1 Tax=Alginatibacterium sediminis TaxID=2164068 RepID=A0A420E7K4_9ALTE|nr:sensor domain-containing diguanylate cyclase [Alginatibacterium sediminis]RKF13702.1 diguanylate cyclase [Alginatibacterium sediminis]